MIAPCSSFIICLKFWKWKTMKHKIKKFIKRTINRRILFIKKKSAANPSFGVDQPKQLRKASIIHFFSNEFMMPKTWLRAVPHPYLEKWIKTGVHTVNRFPKAPKWHLRFNSDISTGSLINLFTTLPNKPSTLSRISTMILQEYQCFYPYSPYYPNHPLMWSYTHYPTKTNAFVWRLYLRPKGGFFAFVQ